MLDGGLLKLWESVIFAESSSIRGVENGFIKIQVAGPSIAELVPISPSPGLTQFFVANFMG